MEKRKLLEEMPQEKPKETENLREEARPASKKTKFGKKAIEDEESSCEYDEKMDFKTILIGTFLISLKCSTTSLTLPCFFKSKEMEESLVEVQKEHLLVEEKHSQRVITIDPFEGSRAQNVILEKPTMEMTRHIRPLYVRAHFNGKTLSKVLWIMDQ